MIPQPEEPTPAPLNVLVCFAVREEAKFFKPKPHQKVVFTGMGRNNAARVIENRCASHRPDLVVTCGFAGGLNPIFSESDVVFDADTNTPLESKLNESGAKRATFFCANRVAITSEEKLRLWRYTGMDIVEMESETIRDHCRDLGIPSATIRSICDSAHDDLPLDFNLLMNNHQNVNYKKMSWLLIKSPRLIIELLAFQKKTTDAAQALATCLEKSLP